MPSEFRTLHDERRRPVLQALVVIALDLVAAVAILAALWVMESVFSYLINGTYFRPVLGNSFHDLHEYSSIVVAILAVARVLGTVAKLLLELIRRGRRD